MAVVRSVRLYALVSGPVKGNELTNGVLDSRFPRGRTLRIRIPREEKKRHEQEKPRESKCPHVIPSAQKHETNPPGCAPSLQQTAFGVSLGSCVYRLAKCPPFRDSHISPNLYKITSA